MEPQGKIRRFVNRQVGKVRRGIERASAAVANRFGAGRGRGGIVNRSR